MATATGNTLAHALEMGLIESEYDLILAQLKREPTPTELGMYAVMWSEHCGYKYSRPVLSYFKKYKEAMEGDGHENAGIVPLGDGLGVTFKIESHNHPSAVEPYQGAATGVGGILRDVFTMGARPIAALNSLRFGPLLADDQTTEEVAQRNRYLFDHVVRGIAGYGNCVGVPTVGGEVEFHWRYSGNPLVNAMAVGIVETSKITTAGAAGIGNPVIYMGSATGKDGIHGASFASQTLDEESEAKRPNVQIGDPFAEKLLIEATLEALETGAIVAIQDMGAAGLTCSTVEMSAKGRVGMEVDLDLVPAREVGMSAYELMLSESQERMLCVAEKGRENEVLDVFRKWGLHAVVIGHVIAEERLIIRRQGKVEVDLWPPHLADQCPVYHQRSEEAPYYAMAAAFDLASVPVAEPGDALLALLRSPNLASKRWVYQQFDQEVQTQTIVRPGRADAAVLAPRGTEKGISIAIDGNGFWTYFDPYVGGLLAVVESARNVACTGARPAACTDGLNFGNPQNPHVFWQFDRCVKGIADAAEAMQTPVVSGNVSFYNESEVGGAKTEVLPTAMIGMVGILSKSSDVLQASIPAEGLDIAILGYSPSEIRHQGLGASAYLSSIHQIDNGLPTGPDLSKEKALCDLLADLAEQGLIRSAHDVSTGGLAVALAESAMDCGAEIDLPNPANLREDAILFGETPGRVVISMEPENREAVERLASSRGLEFLAIGCSKLGRFSVSITGNERIAFATEQLKLTHEMAISSVMQ